MLKFLSLASSFCCNSINCLTLDSKTIEESFAATITEDDKDTLKEKDELKDFDKWLVKIYFTIVKIPYYDKILI
jgi:hypothetical protein